MVQGDFQACGQGTLTSGNDRVTISVTGVTSTSKIFITPLTSTSYPLDFVIENRGIDTFDVFAPNGIVEGNIDFDWIAFEG